MPQSQSVTNLKINTLTSAQYDTAVRQGDIGENELSILTDIEYPESVHLETSNAVSAQGIILPTNYIWNNISAGMTLLAIADFPANVTASYKSWMNFTSGATPTNCTYPTNKLIWRGDDVVSGNFTPAANKRYCISFTYDGVSKFRGLVQGEAL